MLENVYAYFRENIQKNEQQIAILKRKIHTIGTIRLLIVLMAIALFYFIPFLTWLERLVVLALFAIPFIGLMVYHNRLFAQRTDCEALLAYNQKELKALDYDFSALIFLGFVFIWRAFLVSIHEPVRDDLWEETFGSVDEATFNPKGFYRRKTRCGS